MSGRELPASILSRLLPECTGPSSPPRLLVVAAHPDDETLGASWLLRNVADTWVLHLTDGAPRDASLRSPSAPRTRESYACLREKEAVAALGRAGLPRERLLSFGVVDQEAVLALAALSLRLTALIEKLRPTALVIHSYEGGHPDHDAAAFVAHAAEALTASRGGASPRLLEMTSYHRRGGGLVTGEFLPDTRGGPVTTVELSAEDLALKREMLGCYASQAQVLAVFKVDRERYRLAPRYDFSLPPHPGTPHYESLGWAMTGARWRELARAAREELGLPGALS